MADKVAGIVVIGIALPPLGAVLKPYVTEAVFMLLYIAFLRIDSAGFKTCLRRPLVVLAATAWTSAVVPALFGVGCHVLGLDRQVPGLFLGLMLQAIASLMMAVPALVVLMELDATLVLVTLITSTALIPITAPLFTLAFVGLNLPVSPVPLAVKLFVILAGAAAVGFVARRIFGMASVKRHEERLNGLNILVLFVFVSALMEKVGVRIHGLTAKHGFDACSNRWSPARSYLALFCPFPVSHLPVATASPATGPTHYQYNRPQVVSDIHSPQSG